MDKLLALGLYVLVILAMRAGDDSLPTEKAAKALDAAREKYAASLMHMEAAISELNTCASRDGLSHQIECRNSYLELRSAYKQVEVLLDYLDHESVSMFFNGAPLLTLEQKVPEIVVLEPEGLQVIDEVIFLSEEESVQEDLHELTELLTTRYKVLKATQRPNAVQHHHVWNGMRVSLVRLFTLGLTGFDTPGSLRAINDAYVTMNTLREYYGFYEHIVTERDHELAAELNNLFAGAIGQLQMSDDFNSFDRLSYLTRYINPLFGRLLEAQHILGVALPHEVVESSAAIDLRATNLFSPGLFNKGYYTGMEWEKVPDEKIDLGRMLFFDPVLSSSLNMSCASCHQPDKAFTDGAVKSVSANKGTTVKRNSPTLVNCVYTERFFLDMREDHLERQVKHVVMDSLEFNTDFIEIVDRLEGSEEYKAVFAKAYPDTKYQLSKWSVSDALATYVASLTSFESPVDKYIRGEETRLSEEAYRGFNVFMGKGACGTCHFAPTFNGNVPPFYQHSESEVLGVPSTPDTIGAIIDPDPGRIASGRPTDGSEIYYHAFKTTTVRNAALTAPYMHNGVYETLEEVIDFYNRGGGAGMGIDVPNQTLPDAPLELTKREVGDLVAFMEALTDTTGLKVMPSSLPKFERNPQWNKRPVGGSNAGMR